MVERVEGFYNLNSKMIVQQANTHTCIKQKKVIQQIKNIDSSQTIVQHFMNFILNQYYTPDY